MPTEAALTFNHLFAGIAVADYEAALTWYTRFFGRAPDVVVTEHEAMWHIADAGSIYLVADAARAGRALLTLAVDDLAQLVADLTERRIATGPLNTEPEVPKNALITDPEGNRLTVFENPGSRRPDTD
jgi:predicted enzyme related to lactoylglutathione lyase